MAIRQSAGGARKLQGQVSPPLPIPIQPGTTTQLLSSEHQHCSSWVTGGDSRLYRLKCPDWRCVAIFWRAEPASVTTTILATWAGDLSCSCRTLLVTEDILYQYTLQMYPASHNNLMYGMESTKVCLRNQKANDHYFMASDFILVVVYNNASCCKYCPPTAACCSR